jgi:hypothetical protein
MVNVQLSDFTCCISFKVVVPVREYCSPVFSYVVTGHLEDLKFRPSKVQRKCSSARSMMSEGVTFVQAERKDKVTGAASRPIQARGHFIEFR